MDPQSQPQAAPPEQPFTPEQPQQPVQPAQSYEQPDAPAPGQQQYAQQAQPLTPQPPAMPQEMQQPGVAPQPQMAQAASMAQQPGTPQQAPAPATPQHTPASAGGSVFSYIKKALLNPVATYKSHANAANTPAFALTLAGSVIAASVLLNLLTTMFSSMRVVEHSFLSILSGKKAEVTWTTEPLGELEYGQLIMTPLISYAVIIFAFAAGYMLTSKILAKRAQGIRELSFWRVTTALTTAYIPLLIVALPLTPFLEMWGVGFLFYISFGLTIIASSYMVSVIVSTINDDLTTGASTDATARVHLIAVSAISLAGLITLVQLMGGPEAIQGLGALGELGGFLK